MKSNKINSITKIIRGFSQGPNKSRPSYDWQAFAAASKETAAKKRKKSELLSQAKRRKTQKTKNAGVGSNDPPALIDVNAIYSKYKYPYQDILDGTQQLQGVPELGAYLKRDSVLVIEADCGMGKSWQIRKLMAKQQFRRILCISVRRSHAANMKAGAQ